MKYKLWNEAFVKHFFEENKNKEIILYVDEDIIKDIGEKNNLGGVIDFLNAIIVDVDERSSIYQKNIGRLPRGNVQFNRNMQAGSIFDFAAFLSENAKKKLPFLNYVILAIYAKTDLDQTDRSYYNNLNSLINCIDDTQRRIGSNNIKLDVLFNSIENFDPRFKNELIGKLAFMGLLKYQVVLSPRENYEFEETLFKYQIGIFEDSSYHQFANRFLAAVPSQYKSLQEKIKLGGKDPVYARWFINRVKSFNPEEFSQSNPSIKQGKQVGEIAIVFNPIDKKYLYLAINTIATSNVNIGDYKFILDEKNEDGFSTNPILLNNKKEVDFKNHENIENEDYKFSFLPLKGVNFFQKNNINHYQQVVNPIANTETYIVVENNSNEIKKWEKWKDKNTTKCIDAIDITLTKALFTDKYILYSADSINKEFYTRNTIVDAIDYSKELYIKKIGGYKLKGRNTYFDVALPSFKIQNPIKADEEIKVVVKTNGNKDVDIKYHILPNNLINFFLSKNKVIIQEQEISITFKLNKLVKEFSFIVIPSEANSPPLDTLFKLNKWGVNSDSDKVWYNGNEIKGSEKVSIGNGKHKLEGLGKKFNGYNNYFIYLLSALTNKKISSELTHSDIIELIALAKTYYNINNIDYSINSYSSFNIIRNLIALEYINKRKNDKNENIYQIVPPSLFRLERSFSVGGNQIYKLSGARSRRLDQVVEEFCRDNSIKIKYLDFEDTPDQPIEHLILPSLVFLDSNINVGNLSGFVKKELGITLLFQDEHHIGDSLLSFIESVESFEGNFLQESGGNYKNQEFEEGENPTLPRIIESKTEFRGRGQLYKRRYLRISEDNRTGVFSPDRILINWAKLYVAYKQKKVVVFFKQPQWNGSEYNFNPEILIPKTVVVPSILYKALTGVNHGIPKTIKGFVANANDDFEMQKKRFIYLDSYRIGNKPERRESISRILTGNKKFLNNSQIAFYSDPKHSAFMYFVNCTTFSSVSNLIIFKDLHNSFIALCDNYKNIYVLSEKGNRIKIDDQILKVEKIIKKDESINQIFSEIISGHHRDFKTTMVPENELVVETLKEEEIRILNLEINAN